MPTYFWRRFRRSRSSFVAESGVNSTSHHLRCSQIVSVPHPTPTATASSKIWFGTNTEPEEDEEPLLEPHIPQYDESWTTSKSKKHSPNVRQASKSSTPTSRFSVSLPTLKRPSRCLLPTSMRFTSLIMYITFVLLVFSTTTLAVPLHHDHSLLRLDLVTRQAIPDSTGQTGNEPAPIKSQSPSQLATPTTTISANPLPEATIPPHPLAQIRPNPAPMATPTILPAKTSSALTLLLSQKVSPSSHAPLHSPQA
ncbi:hypothetical protein B0J11DRAFT_616822 [Dendryphion nanum]|uniref:Transmembrane protein n=1 Tax=Dendryphion nanum TaxID=256645 RepID=A0A9P9DID8_9PLEO|nr:hypothetical protein B0J11DRAFT_616822 [Dendryphion nanum]